MSLRDLRNLPGEVLERLAPADPELLVAAGGEMTQRGARLEARSNRLELREGDNGDAIVDGYATVYETSYDVYGGPESGYGWSETIGADACARSVRERDDVRLYLNHTGLTLARSERSRTLRLSSDTVGLAVEATIDRSMPTVQDIIGAMNRGDIDEMSFAFRVLRQEWNGDYTERRILEVRLYDVAIVSEPANPAAIVQLRDALGAAEDPRPSMTMTEALSIQAAALRSLASESTPRT